MLIETSPKSNFHAFYGAISIFKDNLVNGYAVHKFFFFEILHLYIGLWDLQSFSGEILTSPESFFMAFMG